MVNKKKSLQKVKLQIKEMQKNTLKQKRIQQDIEARKKKLAKKGHELQKKAAHTPYTTEQQILLVGEGNFSFARSLAELHETAIHITATCYDSDEVLHKKYDDVKEHLQVLRNLSARIKFEVDATKLHEDPDLRERKYDRIVFNFPHTGSGIKDKAINIAGQQKLISKFFMSAAVLLKDENSQIHVTIKKGEPYNSWRVAQLARNTGILKLVNASTFFTHVYPHYVHRRTLGFDSKISDDNNEDISVGATLFAFSRSPNFATVSAEAKKKKLKKQKLKKAKQQQESDDDEDEEEFKKDVEEEIPDLDS